RERGRWRVPGERWRGGPCRVCQCLPGGEVRCVPYCPLRDTGCPQGRVLREGDGGSCCTCGPAGEWGVPRGPGGERERDPTAALGGLPSELPKSAEAPPEPPSAAGGIPRSVTTPEDTPRS
ncbi:SSPO protein, partial [Scytalopus superciliaris]|nr:SSPO protein [Scytalopus superciliaris]